MIFVNIGKWPYAIEEGDFEEGDFRAQGNSYMKGREHACGKFGKAPITDIRIERVLFVWLELFLIFSKFAK